MNAIANYRARHITLAIRRRLQTSYGAEKVVIHRDGRVHAYGYMPNSNVRGWWFAGTDRDIMADLHHEVAIKEGRA